MRPSSLTGGREVSRWSQVRDTQGTPSWGGPTVCASKRSAGLFHGGVEVLDQQVIGLGLMPDRSLGGEPVVLAVGQGCSAKSRTARATCGQRGSGMSCPTSGQVIIRAPWMRAVVARPADNRRIGSTSPTGQVHYGVPRESISPVGLRPLACRRGG